jgi:putative phosphoribosyl transferase
MYFKNRAQAGRQLAQYLDPYHSEVVSVVALSEGAILVAAQIAMRIHASLSLLMSERIFLPGELEALSSITADGSTSLNDYYSVGQLEAMMADYHGFIEEEKIRKIHELNRLISHDGEINKNILNRHAVILVSDGLYNGFSLKVAYEFLKPVSVKRLIAATPFASVDAADKMHLAADEVHCLDVKANYVNTNHYYEDNTIPPIDSLYKVMRNIANSWQL